MFGYPFRPPGAQRVRPSVRTFSLSLPKPGPSPAPPNEDALRATEGLAVAPARKENRPAHPFVRPASPAPPATPRPRPNPAPAPPPPQQDQVPPPNCYAASDPGIFWLNSRPYWVHRLLGAGGFGEVHEVEMLLPRGLEVDWDENGDLSFDEHGCLALKRSDDSAAQGSRPLTRTDADMDTLSSLGALEAEVSLSSMSMTTSESNWFSLVRREQALNGGHLSGGGLGLSSEDGDARAAVDAAATKSTNVYDHFSADSDRFLERSGVFYGLKLQSARNEKQLESLVKEVENMRLLSGQAGIVQLRDHSIDRKSLHLVILMELGACDLHEFLKQKQYCLDVQSIARVWSVLVHRIETLHRFDVIHRDIKPQNFILVPTDGYRGAAILGRTSIPRKDFVFRPTHKEGVDVELVLKDPTTNKEEVVPLSIKLTDFGIAQSLDADGASHKSLSLPGPNGTVVFMAPEAVRQTVNRCRKVSKRVDIWALGVILYQMLHDGKTPFGEYLIKGGPPEALLAVASETVNLEAMNFDASNIWSAERARILFDSSGTHPVPSQDFPTMTAEMVEALVVSWVGAELLVRVCKRCLVFDVDDRIDGADLRVWVDGAIESSWGRRKFDVSQSELLQTAFNIDANGMMQTVDIEIARIGERIGASLFPGIWMPSLSASSSSSPSPKINDKYDPEAGPSALPPSCCSESADSSDHRPRRLSFLQILTLIIVSLMVGAGLCATIGAAVRGPWSGMGGGEDIVPSSNDGKEVPRPSSFLGGGVAGGGAACGGVAGGGAADDVVAGDSVVGGSTGGGDAVGGSAGGGGAPTGGVLAGGISVGGGTGDGGSAHFSQPPQKHPVGVVDGDFGPNGSGVIPPASATVFSSPCPSPSSSSSSGAPPPASHPKPRAEPSSSRAAQQAQNVDPVSFPNLPHEGQERHCLFSCPDGGQQYVEKEFAFVKNRVLERLRSSNEKLAIDDTTPAFNFVTDIWYLIGNDQWYLTDIWYTNLLAADREVMLELVAKNAASFFLASKELSSDPDFVLAAVEANSEVFYHAGELASNRNFVLAVVTQNGLALEFAGEFRSDKGIVLAAVTQNGLALEFAQEQFQSDKGIALKAVEANGLALQYARYFWGDEGIVLAAVSGNGESLQYAAEKFQTNKEFVLKAVEANGLALQSARYFWGDEGIVLAAVSGNGESLRYASQAFQTNREFVLKAVEANGLALKYARPNFQGDEVVVLAAVLQNAQALQYATVSRII